MDTSITLTDQQNQAVEMALAHGVSILTGGPGTGKTTTCRAIIDKLMLRGKRIGMCAPSGKAARRITESTDHPAYTIHTLLGAAFDIDSGGFYFKYGLEEQLPYDFVIVDETSMVSIDLMASLMCATKERSQVLFVGDQDQLPSVGPGAVLRDMLACGVIPHTELDIIHRNSGDIVKACHAIKHGNLYEPPDALDLDAGHNIRHIEVKSEDRILEVIVDLVKERLPKYGFNPVWDIQVIAPLRERTRLSCENLNAVLQDALNPVKGRNDEPAADNTNGKRKVKFRVGDKVINTKNTNSKEGEFIANGDIGEMTSEKGIRFFNPDRDAEIGDGKLDLLLAYAITCHRFQGSEAPVVIIPVHPSFGFFVDRSWIYTAISRAKVICITVGYFSSIEKAIGRVGSNQRVTRLGEFIQTSKSEWEKEKIACQL